MASLRFDDLLLGRESLDRRLQASLLRAKEFVLRVKPQDFLDETLDTADSSIKSKIIAKVIRTEHVGLLLPSEASIKDLEQASIGAGLNFSFLQKPVLKTWNKLLSALDLRMVTLHLRVD
jgi:hypothetical protein